MKMLLFNQIIISLFPTVEDLIPTLVIVGIFIGIGAITCLVINSKAHDRASLVPLCVWEYAAAEWQKYAADYDLAKFPKGAAKVSITLLDVWIMDDGMVRRTILDDDRKCVTACRFSNQILKIRVRSWACPTRSSTVHYSVQDIFLPVPIGREREMVEVAKVFNENIVRMNKKVSSVMPDNFLNGIVGEGDF